MRSRVGGIRGFEQPDGRGVCGLDRGDMDAFGTGRSADHIARHAFLQQQLHSLDHRFGVKARAQQAVLHRIGDRGDRHALVMCHEAADQGMRQSGRHPVCGEIDRLIEPEPPLGPDPGQPFVILKRPVRIDHGGQPAGIGRDDPVFLQAALQAQSRHAEVGILIGHVQIAGVVGGFRNAPGNADGSGIALLARHDQPVCLFQNRSGRGAHHKRRHQVFEHAARPGNQRRSRADRRRRPAQTEPVPGRHIALGDGEQAGQPRLGRQKVIAIAVQSVGRHGKADGQQLLFGMLQKAEVHRQRQVARQLFQRKQGLAADRLRHLPRQAVVHRPRPIQCLWIGQGFGQRQRPLRDCQKRGRISRPAGGPGHLAQQVCQRADFGRFGQRCPGQQDRVQHARPHLVLPDRPAAPVPTGAGHRNQVPCQIAAVDG